MVKTFDAEGIKSAARGTITYITDPWCARIETIQCVQLVRQVQ